MRLRLRVARRSAPSQLDRARTFSGLGGKMGEMGEGAGTGTGRGGGRMDLLSYPYGYAYYDS